MSGKRYFASMAQSDETRGYKRPVHLSRHWPRWAFDAYAWAWLNQHHSKPEGDA